MKVQATPSSGFRRVHRARHQAVFLTGVDLSVVDLWSTTAGRRIHAHRTDRRRAVFSYQAPSVDEAEEPPNDLDGQRSAIAARLNGLRTRRPFSPVSGTALRPVTDAANTLTILREILRGAR